MIYKPRADDQKCTTFSSMTVNTYSSSLFKTHFENIHDTHHMFKSSTGHVLPTFVKAVYSMLIEVFRNVAKRSIKNQTISTVRMLFIIITTSPGSCKLRTVLMFFSLNLA